MNYRESNREMKTQLDEQDPYKKYSKEVKSGKAVKAITKQQRKVQF